MQAENSLSQILQIQVKTLENKLEIGFHIYSTLYN